MPSYSVQVVLFNSASAMIFLIYDTLLMLDQEVEYIWSKPNTAWVKWQYLFLRYFGIGVQIVNRVLQFNVTFRSPLNAHSLRNWFISQVVVENILMIAFEVVLAVRVYALYEQRRWVLYLLACLCLGEFTAMIAGIVVTLPDPNQFTTWTLLRAIPESFAYFGIAAAVSQCTIISLTVYKYYTAVRGGWSGVPIMSLMIRDGTATFTVMFVCCTATVVATISDSAYAPMCYIWLISVISAAGCRLIINMQSLPKELVATSGPTVQMTTIIPDTVYSRYDLG